MKKLMTICLVCVLTATAWGSFLGYTINFDENGGSSWANNQSSGTLPFVYEGSSGLLYYGDPLYSITQGGEVKINEPGTQTLGDCLIFGNGYIYVYSDIDSGDHDIADVGFDHMVGIGSDPVISIDEVGNEGLNGVTYMPAPNQPGFIPGGVIYNFASDVPEPATICMLGIGALSLLRRKK
jgi:hypothetical protein